MNDQPVRDWMTKNPVTITPETTLPEAKRIMLEGKFRRLPVLRRGKLIGIVTFGDIREAQPSDATSLSIYELNYLLDKLNVTDFMTRDPITVTPDARIGEAAALMLKHKIGGLLVVEGGELVGIITETDLCRLLVLEPETIA